MPAINVSSFGQREEKESLFFFFFFFFLKISRSFKFYEVDRRVEDIFLILDLLRIMVARHW